MKVLVGILYCGENEFTSCLASIKSQNYKHFDYFIIENLPNQLAHNSLYQKFMNRANEFEYFIKIDADMVLCRNTFFTEVISEMENSLEIDNLQIAVHDYFTDSLIYGLHVYRSSVKWRITDIKNDIFVDRIEIINKRKNDKTKLAPAAKHAPNPSLFHSYHFGLHKTVKIIQPTKKHLDMESSTFHFSNIINTFKHYSRTRNKKLLFALEGFNDTIKYKYNPSNINYNDPFVKSIYDSKIIEPTEVIKKFKKNIVYEYPENIRFRLFMENNRKYYNQ